MPVARPRFQQLDVADLRHKLDRLSSLVEENTTADGRVDLGALEARVDATGDAALQSTFERVRHDHLRQHGQLAVKDSETNPHWAVRHDADPALLAYIPASDLQAVMASLIAAKIAVQEADADGDGRLSRSEVLERREVGDVGSGQGVADALLASSSAAFDQALQRWLGQASRSAEEMRLRGRLHAQIERAVEAKVQTPQGREAARWYLREHVMGARLSALDGDVPERRLRKADSSFWTRMFGSSAPHLDDAEIARLVGTGDLAAFARGAKARIEEKLGGPFAEAWLDGLNIADPRDAQDPGFLFRPLPS